jgi:hypothetical protein
MGFDEKKGKIERRGRRGTRRKQLLDVLKEKEKILEHARGRTRSHSVENLL